MEIYQTATYQVKPQAVNYERDILAVEVVIEVA